MKRKDIELLAQKHKAPCISIYLPTHRTGEAVLKGEDRLLLKKLLKEARRSLEHNAYTNPDIDTFLSPIEALIDAKQDWKFREEGLAIFVSDSFTKIHSLPIRFRPQTCVSNMFYLVPLMPLLVDDGTFFLLTLELNEIKLYKVSRYQIMELFLEGGVPLRLEETVGYDFEQKSLQYRSQQQGHRETVFHGQGEGKEDRKDEILKFFREVDHGLATMLRTENIPLLVAGLDDQFPIYKKANTYPFLIEKNLSCHPTDLGKKELHTRAWQFMEPEFLRPRLEKLKMFEQNRDTQITSQSIEEIIPMAIKGRVDTLFIERDFDAWGIYDPKKYHLKISPEHRSPAVPLDNLMASWTFLQGGKVYLMDKDDMPVSSSPCCVLYKY